MSPYAIAVLFTLASTALYALGYALAKVLAESLHPFEITFLRSALVLASVMALTMVKPAPLATITRIALPARPWAQRMTGAMLIFSTTLGVIGYWLVPITEAAALGFTAPVILAALGAIWLKEEVSARRWIAVLLGFAGMLVVVRPGGELFTWYAAIPVASALSYATYQVMARRIPDGCCAAGAGDAGAVAEPRSADLGSGRDLYPVADGRLAFPGWRGAAGRGLGPRPLAICAHCLRPCPGCGDV